jgi:UDP-N-acetylmuramoyl-tripeptide--D-alanyl-D-alanine ligase
MEIHELDGLVLINDAYNSSPESAEAALRTLVLFAQERGGQSWAFLGKMHELGESSPQRHASLGTLASELGIDHLVCINADEYAAEISPASQISVHKFTSFDQAQELVSEMNQGDVLLVKASRAEKFELLADLITKTWGERSTEGES